MTYVNQPPAVYDIDETADRLRCGTTTIRRLIADGSLISAKIGRRRVVTAESLTAYLAEVTATATTAAATSAAASTVALAATAGERA